jgi:hypothetical protein
MICQMFSCRYDSMWVHSTLGEKKIKSW